MRAIRDVNSWTLAWALALLSLEMIQVLPVQARQDTLDLADQGHEPRHHHPKHHHYKLVDMGTFGGPASYVNFNATTLNNRGTVVGSSQITTPQPPTTNTFGCPAITPPVSKIYKAFEWRHGAVHDLGTLPGGNCSNAITLNAKNEITGNSETGSLDPLTGFNELRAVIWQNSLIKNLGTLGGNHSGAQAINDRGQVTGFALNDIADPYSMFDLSILGSSNGTQTRAFIWHNEEMEDLGTLGGPDAVGWEVNERGQVAGFSYTNASPSSVTSLPEVHPFLWDKGEMKDLGSFGGSGFPFGSVGINGMNNRGQVIGDLPLPGDQVTHPYLWDGTKLIDMATQGTGGTFFQANVINDAGEVAGGIVSSINDAEAGLWKDGVVTHLGFLKGDCSSLAWSISARGQVGGVSISCDGSLWRAFLWEHGSMVDLNSLIPAGSSLQLIYAVSINDRGEISGNGVAQGVSTGMPEQDTMSRAFLLIPCDEDHSDIEGCDYDTVDAESTAEIRSAQMSERTAPISGKFAQTKTMDRYSSALAHRNHPLSGLSQK